ncbi:telomerase protein component 1-like isoform X2 [Cuculus canorus]|uniref:telomerase protein component 1-like isoform X2 n=1 Tax=Cuculus canorus TaxID=55661 RepID=UPI0023AAADC9|nr:telomerase protein component 1-like isoform X2 [Cuculus canorus]
MGAQATPPPLESMGAQATPPPLESTRTQATPPRPLAPPSALPSTPPDPVWPWGTGGGAVCVHRVPWGSPPLVLPAASGHVTSLAWAGPCALVGGGASGSLWLWAWPRLGYTPSSSSHHHFRPRPPRELPLGRGGVRAMGGAEGRVVVATDDGSVAVMGAMGQPHTWGAPRETLWIRPHLGPTECVGLSPTGAALATGGADGAVAVWGVGDAVGLKRRWLRAHSDGVCAVGWTGDLLVSGGSGGSLSLWAVVSGQRLRTLEGLRGAPSALGGEGRWVLAVSRDGSLAAWEGAELVGHVGGRGQSRGDIAPPGRRQPLVAVVGPDELTHLWEPLKEPRPITLCSAGGAEVVGVAVAGHAPSASSHAPAFNANGRTSAEHAHTASGHAHPASGHAHSVSGYAYPRSSHAPSSGFGHAPSSGSGHAPPVAVAAASDGSVRVIPLPPPGRSPSHLGAALPEPQ